MSASMTMETAPPSYIHNLLDADAFNPYAAGS